MRLYPFVFRLSVVLSLVVASAVGGGWKWDLVH